MNIEKKIIHVTQQKLLKAARQVEIDTGDKREVKTIKADGTEVIEHVPIMQPVNYQAVYEDVQVPKEVFAVKTIARTNGPPMKSKGGVLVQEMEEEHHFATAEDAERFVKDSQAPKPTYHDMINNLAKLNEGVKK